MKKLDGQGTKIKKPRAAKATGNNLSAPIRTSDQMSNNDILPITPPSSTEGSIPTPDLKINSLEDFQKENSLTNSNFRDRNMFPVMSDNFLCDNYASMYNLNMQQPFNNYQQPHHQLFI